MSFRILRAELQNEKDSITRADSAAIVEPLNYWTQSRFLDAAFPNVVRLGERTWEFGSQGEGNLAQGSLGDLLEVAAERCLALGLDPFSFQRLSQLELPMKELAKAIDDALRLLDELEFAQATIGSAAPPYPQHAVRAKESRSQGASPAGGDHASIPDPVGPATTGTIDDNRNDESATDPRFEVMAKLQRLQRQIEAMEDPRQCIAAVSEGLQRRWLATLGDDGAEATKPTEKPATVNERMAGTIMENSEAMGWNSAQWAKHLKCAKSSVVDAATWKKLESARQQAKAERMKDRRRKPKASDSRRD